MQEINTPGGYYKDIKDTENDMGHTKRTRHGGSKHTLLQMWESRVRTADAPTIEQYQGSQLSLGHTQTLV